MQDATNQTKKTYSGRRYLCSQPQRVTRRYPSILNETNRYLHYIKIDEEWQVSRVHNVDILFGRRRNDKPVSLSSGASSIVKYHEILSVPLILTVSRQGVII
jgi:hypothetical protein